jgi:TPP-dependent pyruvate/acetoin dehydrogenase alpha subunit
MLLMRATEDRALTLYRQGRSRAVFTAAAEACERARSGGGPALIEAETLRMHGHGAHDDMRYVPEEMFDEWEARDPIRRYEERLGAEGIDVEPIRASVEEELERETAWALEQPMPDPQIAPAGAFADARYCAYEGPGDDRHFLPGRLVRRRGRRARRPASTRA